MTVRSATSRWSASARRSWPSTSGWPSCVSGSASPRRTSTSTSGRSATCCDRQPPRRVSRSSAQAAGQSLGLRAQVSDVLAPRLDLLGEVADPTEHVLDVDILAEMADVDVGRKLLGIEVLDELGR